MQRTRLSQLASALADDTRSRLVLALMDGRARTGSELAGHLGLARSTISEHLGRLQDAGLVAVEAQGRHRYHRLASPEVAELIETMCGSAPAVALDEPAAPAALAHARTCYDHLAGRLAVAIWDHLVEAGHLQVTGPGREALSLSASGRELLAGIGVDRSALDQRRRPPIRRCLDWTERRHHLAGAVGAALLDAVVANRWLTPGQRPRELRVTPTGQDALVATFGLHRH